MSPRGRRLAARALVVVASIGIVLALVVEYVERAAVNSDQFANRATVALRNDSVRSLIAERITDDVVIKNQEDLLAARPIIEAAASGIVGSSAFTGLFRKAVRDVHRALFDRDENTVTLTVGDVGTVLAAALEKLRPSLAHQVKATERVALVQRDVGSLSASLARVADTVRVLSLLLTVLALVAVAAAIAISPERRHTVVELGVGVAVGGILLVVAYGILRPLAIDHVEGPEARAAAGAVWDAYLVDLRTAAWILAGSGAVVAAAAASLIRPFDIGEPVRRVAGWVVREPRRPALRALRGISLVVVGVAVIVARSAFLQLVVTVFGVYLIYEGVTALLKLIYKPPEPGTERPRRPARRAVASVRQRREVGAAVLGIALVTVAVVTFVGSGGASTPSPARGSCNGQDALCDRRLDQIALPATHNSMSAPLPGWFSSQQDAPIANQLADGIRGLLLDTHYADRLSNGKLRTVFGSNTKLQQLAREDGVSQDALDSALRIRDRLGFSGKGERGMYLCHTLCELGGTPLASVLTDLHDFLVAHPDDVVVVINQDYVTPTDFVGAVKSAGLESMVYRGPTTAGRWLTMRQMIDRNQRLVLLAEHRAGAAPWYHLAYQTITEETPYAFKRVSQLTDPTQLARSCRPNRGAEGAPLFLVNHWITTDPLPLPSNAAKVNAYRPLLARLRECEEVRRHIPNLVAVDFYRRGDLFRAVNALNGVR